MIMQMQGTRGLCALRALVASCKRSGQKYDRRKTFKLVSSMAANLIQVNIVSALDDIHYITDREKENHDYLDMKFNICR